MAYREGRNPRVAELRAQIAREHALLAKRDELRATEAVLLAEGEALRKQIALGSRLRGVNAELAQQVRTIDEKHGELQARQAAVAEELAAIAAATQELAALVNEQVAALRHQGHPTGVALLALEEQVAPRARDAAKLDDVRRVLAILDAQVGRLGMELGLPVIALPALSIPDEDVHAVRTALAAFAAATVELAEGHPRLVTPPVASALEVLAAHARTWDPLRSVAMLGTVRDAVLELTTHWRAQHDVLARELRELRAQEADLLATI